MDEILIEEKKYVSSKRAAKITGYAKDYIGQLCREGRVPARLVGRSWYVLETAIQDHRFGDTSDVPMKNEKKATRPEESATAFPSTWEAPRYEASSAVELLPSVNRLQSTETLTHADTREDSEISSHLQDSWRAWFERIEPAIPDDMPDMPSPEPVKILEREADMPESEEDKGVEIPIRSVYEPIITESLPPIAVVVEPQRGEGRPVYQEERRGKRSLLMPMQLAGMFFAFIMAIMAIIGSGYFDTYIISSGQASVITGVSIYNK